MTIRNPEQFRQALEQMQRLYEALAALKAEVSGQSPRKFEVFAEGTVEHIRRLRDSIDDYAGAKAVAEAAAPLWLRVAGPDVEWPEAPTSVLTEFLDALRKGILAVAEMLATGALSQRPRAELRRACDLQVISFATGSLKVGLKLPEPDDDGVSVQDSRTASAAMTTYLRAATWTASDSTRAVLADTIHDPALRRVALTELSRMVPRQRGQVLEVEFSGSALPSGQRASLTRQSKERIIAAIREAPSEETEEHDGLLIELDLERYSFRMRVEAGPDVSCDFSDEWKELAKKGLDRWIRVIGTRAVSAGRRPRPLQVRHLEILDEEH